MSQRYQHDRITAQYLCQPNGPGAGLAGIQSQQIVLSGETLKAGIGQSSGVETWDVPGNMLPQWFKGMLGIGIKNGTAIQRTLPAQHPFMKNMYCASIDVEGEAPFGQDQFNSGVANWKRWRTKVYWETPPYAVLSDNQIIVYAGSNAPETFRYFTLVNYQANSQVYQRRQGTFSYSSQAPGLSGNLVQIPESGGASQVVTKISEEYLWVQVPDNGLFSGGFPGAPANILAAIGCVNNSTFLGRPAGTMLFDNWHPVARTYPAEPIDLNLQPFQVPRCWDVQLRFIYFNPPSGMPNGTTAGGQFGHNLVPHPNNGLWYLAYQTGQTESVSTYWRYQPANFNTIFQMN